IFLQHLPWYQLTDRAQFGPLQPFDGFGLLCFGAGLPNSNKTCRLIKVLVPESLAVVGDKPAILVGPFDYSVLVLTQDEPDAITLIEAKHVPVVFVVVGITV